MVATRQARAAASASAARAARLFESLDLGVLSVVASFGYPEELVNDPTRTASLGATVKALHDWQLALNTSRWARAKAEARAAEVAEAEQFGWDQSPGHRGAGLPEEHLWVKESTCFPFEYDGPAFAGRCECCCPPSLRSPVFRKIPVTPKPNDVHAAAWYRDY